MAEQDQSGRLEVTCPLCRGLLTVDRATGVVLHAASAKGERRDFESTIREIRAAQGQREEQFLKAFQSEKQRRASLDDKFEIAREKAEKDPDKKPPNPTDVD